nr:hypothetical protein GCM10010200_069530 [Actinomadura rugatobispora]
MRDRKEHRRSAGTAPGPIHGPETAVRIGDGPSVTGSDPPRSEAVTGHREAPTGRRPYNWTSKPRGHRPGAAGPR